MSFISNGDFVVPLQFPMYWAQHVYTWSFERGAANPDGILRLPGRLLDIAVFAAVGNVGFAYFYLASCLGIAFLAFLWFARSFLDIRRWSTAILGALFFAFNPIFLGNVSKVGLVLAAAMLPLALTALKQGFAQKRFSYFLLFIVALNVSLLHPFTFGVTLFVGGGYACYLGIKHRAFVHDHLWKFGLIGLVTLLLNAYCILPLASLRTIDKNELTATVSSEPVDYTGLVDIANTGDIFTGLSLSKGVLKDYEFFGPMTWPFYFLGIFMFYVLLFGIYIRVEGRAKPKERRRFVLALGIFLALLVLATASYLYADVLIKLLISLPGGWMFRSPLKWQLYMPLALFTALVIALSYVRDGWRLKLLYGAFALSFILMNGYLVKQIYHRLLTPRQVTTFGVLAETDMNDQNLLFADSAACTTFAQDHPDIATELNQVLISKRTQVKHAQATNIDTVNLAEYDYVFGCDSTLDETMLTKQYAFVPAASFAGDVYRLYKNTQPTSYVRAASQIFTIPEAKDLGGKHLLADTILKKPFIFTASTKGDLPAGGLQDVFDQLKADGISHDQITSQLELGTTGQQQLFVTGEGPIYYNTGDGQIELSKVPQPGLERAVVNSLIPLPQTKAFKVSYRDPAFSYLNLVPNPSLEQGLWQKAVGDCNAFDDRPSLTMGLDRKNKTNGRQALVLTAKAHIACTGPDSIPADAGEYLLSFDYQTDGGRDAGYNIGFDNLDQTSISARLDDTNGQWQQYNTKISLPEGAEHLRLVVYAYPDNSPGGVGVARYDNFRLIRIPPITNRFFVLSGNQTSARPPKVDFTKPNPTKTLIHVRQADHPFYLVTKETYHRLWQLHSNGHPAPDHLRLNGTMNGWYIDPATWCQEQAACVTNNDGSYDISLVMEFAPQRWFYRGALISGLTALGVGGYVVYDLWRWRHKGDKQ